MATTEHGGRVGAMEMGGPSLDRPGDLTMLDNTIEGIDHWLGQLIEKANPILRPEMPDAEMSVARLQEPQSPLADRIDRLQALQSLLARTVDRIAL